MNLLQYFAISACSKPELIVEVKFLNAWAIGNTGNTFGQGSSRLSENFAYFNLRMPLVLLVFPGDYGQKRV